MFGYRHLAFALGDQLCRLMNSEIPQLGHLNKGQKRNRGHSNVNRWPGLCENNGTKLEMRMGFEFGTTINSLTPDMTLR